MPQLNENKINLASADGPLELVRIAAANGTFDPTLATQALAGLAIFASNLDNSADLFIDPSFGFPVNVGKNKTRNIAILDLLNLGVALFALKEFPNFERLLRGFSNPRQIFDTIFEVQTAFWCTGLKIVKSISFSPECQVGRRTRVPEFVLQTDLGPIYCECKSFHPENHDAFARFQLVFDHISKAYEKLGIPDTFRLDVHLDSPINGNLGKKVDELVLRVLESYKAGTKSIVESAPFRFVLNERKDASPFKDFNLAQMSISVGTIATKLDVENASIHLSWKDVKLKKKIGNAISEAQRQLPREEKGVIFVQVFKNWLSEAAIASEVRLKDPSFGHVIGIGVWGDGLRFHSFGTATEIVQKIFI